ncbi:MAG TPA: thioredoxin family protein [Blastocatellia bacterium]|nr:thioredoxin family protein [Blastocatellia bacterium]
MRIILLTLLLAAASVASGAAQNEQLAWNDSARDVYINGELDRAAQVLSCDTPRRLALLAAKLDHAIVLDMAGRTVHTLPKDAFRFAADHNTATSDANAPMKAIGKCALVDSYSYVFAVEGKPVVISRHLGFTGEMTEQQLWETVPVWRYLMNDYEPNAEAVAALKAVDKDTQLTLLYGTWCGDSKNYVPKLLKALKAAGNNRLKVRLIGVKSNFQEPEDAIQPRGITNVPTVLVERDGREIGRIVETPAAGTIEEDLAAILNGKPNIHQGRWSRGPEIARGVYAYRDGGGKECGSESWTLYRASGGGWLLHSRIASGDVETEVFQEADEKNKTVFAEITKRRGAEVTRVRYNLDGKTLRGRMRGSASGVAEQTLSIPERLAFSSPAVAGAGLGYQHAAGGGRLPSYFVPRGFDAALGTLGDVSYETKGEESANVPAGQFRAKHIIRRAEAETSEWWLHNELGIPVRGRADGMEYVLVELEVSPAGRK